MNKSKIIIYGATGLIGNELVKKLNTNYKIVVVSRNIEKARKLLGNDIEIITYGDVEKPHIKDSYAVINLVGENLASKRWTKRQKQQIIDSRVNTSKRIVNMINELENKPKVYIQASAIGYYPFSYKNSFTETDKKGNSFLSYVVEKWENEIQALNSKVRPVLLRTGVVLSSAGGMIPKVLLPMKLFIGGKIGSGKQWISWIHIHDQVNAIAYILDNDKLKNEINLCTPEPTTMHTFIKSMAKMLKRPTLFPVPEFVVKLLFGQMGKETILASQKVIPQKLMESGFLFKFPNLNSALKNIVSK